MAARRAPVVPIRPPEPAGPRARRSLRSRLSARPRLVVALVGLAIAAALVVSDLPTRTTADYRQKSLSGYLASIGADTGQCNAGLHDALVAAVASLDNSPSIAPGVAATFAEQGIAACSLTNNAVVDLAQMEPPHGLRSVTVGHLAPRVGSWVYPGAFNLLQDLRAVLAHPRSPTSRGRFSRQLDALETGRSRVEHLVGEAERSEGISARPLVLTDAASLLPGGRLPADHRPGPGPAR